MLRINELLKKIREDRREENRVSLFDFIKKEVNKGRLKEFSEKTLSYKNSFSECMITNQNEGEYLDKILSLRERLEKQAQEYLNAYENVSNLVGTHSFYTDYDGDLYFHYEISYERMETLEELEKRAIGVISKDFKKIYNDLEPYDLIKEININDDKEFTILYKNIEYKYKIKSVKLADKILYSLYTNNETLAYKQLFSGGQTIELINYTVLA